MTITLSGDNDFAVQEELNKITSSFISDYGELSLEKIDGEEAELASTEEAVVSLPFLSPKKMVVIKNLSRNKQISEISSNLLKDIPDSTDIIFVETRPDRRLSFYKFLKDNTDFREFKPLDQNGTVRWLVGLASEKGQLSNSDAFYLTNRVGLNQVLLKNELDKLLLYNPKITKETIDLLTEPTLQSNIFQLLDAAFSSQHKQLLGIYEEQREMKVEPAQIIALMAWQLQAMAIIKAATTKSSGQIAKEAKLNPYVINKSQSIARNLTLARINQLIKSLLNIDISSKTKSIDIDDALKHYLLSLAS